MQEPILASLALAVLAAGTPPASVSADESPRTEWSVSAADLRRDFVPADARLLVHVDVQAFRQTALWNIVQANRSKFELDELDEVQEEYGIDPLTDIHSVTVWSTNSDLEPGAVLVIGNENLDNALNKWKEEKEYRALRKGDLTIHRFEDDAFAYVEKLRDGGRAVLVSEELEQAARGALVMRGELESLASGSSALEGKPRRGSFFYAESGQIPWVAGFQPASQVFGLAQGIQFDFGEAGGSLFGHLSLTTDSPETALNLRDMVNGLMAMGRIVLSQQDEVPMEVGNLLNAVSVSARGNVVAVDFEYDVRALVEFMQSMEDEDDWQEEDEWEEDYR